MRYTNVRGRLKILKRGINIAMVVCLLMIFGLSKPASISKSVEFIAAPLIKPFLDQFRSEGRQFTNIFNL